MILRLPLPFLVALLALVRVGGAQDLVLGETGRLERGRLVAIDDRAVVWRNASGELREMPLDACVAVSSEFPLPIQPSDPGVLVLADGQRLPGRIGLNAGVLTWRHRLIGEWPIDLERLRSLSLVAGVEPPAAIASDVVVLTNGDRVEGIVVALGTSVLVEPLAAAGVDPVPPIEVPLERIAALSLVTRPAPVEGAAVWFADGTVLRTASPRLGDDGIVRLGTTDLTGGAGSLTATVEEVTGIVFRTRSLAPLNTLAVGGVSGPPERYHVPDPRVLDPGPAPLGAPPVRLSGPVEVRYVLPAPGMRFLAEAVIPQFARAWGDLELVLLSGGRELFRHHLDGASPVVPIDILVPGKDLVIELREGRNGPVQDVVVLRRPLLLHQSVERE